MYFYLVKILAPKHVEIRNYIKQWVVSAHLQKFAWTEKLNYFLNFFIFIFSPVNTVEYWAAAQPGFFSFLLLPSKARTASGNIQIQTNRKLKQTTNRNLSKLSQRWSWPVAAFITEVEVGWFTEQLPVEVLLKLSVLLDHPVVIITGWDVGA